VAPGLDAARSGCGIHCHIIDARLGEGAEHVEARSGVMHRAGRIPLRMRVELCLARRHRITFVQDSVIVKKPADAEL
jgi:hypothetical protein